jgi:hypothetical protein
MLSAGIIYVTTSKKSATSKKVNTPENSLNVHALPPQDPSIAATFLTSPFSVHLVTTYYSDVFSGIAWHVS